METITVTFSKKNCDHKNGWHKVVRFKWWIFYFERKYFLCTDCEDLIPMEEINNKK